MKKLLFGNILLLLISYVLASKFTTLCSSDTPLIAEQIAKVSLRIYPKENNTPLQWHQLQEGYGRRLHVVVIGADMNSYLHIHPEDFDTTSLNTSEWSFSFIPKQAGKYVAKIDGSILQDGNRTEIDSYCELFIQGLHPQSSPQSQSYKNVKVFAGVNFNDTRLEPIICSHVELDEHQANGFRVNMYSENNEIKAHECVMIQFEIKNNEDLLPVTNLEPLYGAAAHIIILKEDLSPVFEKNPAAHTHAMPTHSHLMPDHSHESQFKNKCAHLHNSHETINSHFGPSFYLHFFFPEAGNYYLFAQAAVQGNQHLFMRFELKVGEFHQPQSTNHLNINSFGLLLLIVSIIVLIAYVLKYKFNKC